MNHSNYILIEFKISNTEKGRTFYKNTGNFPSEILDGKYKFAFLILEIAPKILLG